MDKRTRPIHVLPTIDSLQIERRAQTGSEGMEKELYAHGNEENVGLQ